MIGISIPPVMGGLEVHTWQLARRLVKAGHTVDLIAWQDRLSGTSTAEGVRVHRLGNYRYRYYWWPAFRLARRLHAERSFDVVHAHTAFPAGLAGALLHIMSRVPLVITSHGSEIRKPMSGPIMTIVRDRLVRFAFARANAVIGASSELADLSIGFGAAPDSTVYLPNATDTEAFHPGVDGRGVRERCGFKADDVVVLFLGHLIRIKGVRYLLEAAARVIADDPNVKFLIVGAGEEGAAMRSWIEDHGLADRFVFVGTIENNDVPSHIAAADMAVFPSLAEATSIACLETMACGCPVVVSNRGGLPEIVDDGDTGLVVEFRDAVELSFADPTAPERVIASLAEAINRLVQDRQLRIDMGERAAAKVRSRFSWNQYVSRVEDIYRRIMKNI